MKPFRFHPFLQLFLTAAVAVVAGCSTVQFREVQRHFEETVQADNQRFASPFGDVRNQFTSVADELSPKFIGSLDSRLQPNAWTLRAVSQWRAGEFTNALASVEQGQAAIGALEAKDPRATHSRDAVILAMLPGLVEDSRLLERLNSGGKADVIANYGQYESRFKTALRAMAEAKARISPVTPPEVGQYWFFQAWRILNNWQIVLAKLPVLDPNTRRVSTEADEFVGATLGADNQLKATSLPIAIINAKAGVPPASPLIKLIELEGQR